MNTNRGVPEDVRAEAQRLGQTITVSGVERRPAKNPPDDLLARSELAVVQEIRMYAARKHGDTLARRLRVRFHRPLDGGARRTTVSLGPDPTAGEKGGQKLTTLAEAFKQLEALQAALQRRPSP